MAKERNREGRHVDSSTPDDADIVPDDDDDDEREKTDDVDGVELSLDLDLEVEDASAASADCCYFCSVTCYPGNLACALA